MLANPFNEQYVTEGISPAEFVKLFSPILVNDVTEIYGPGNVILAGIVGSGKTMLLNLLKPEIRIAYSKAGKEFPVPKSCRRFLGAGINLTRSYALGVGQKLASLSRQEAAMLTITDAPRLFGDFLNYWIVEDIIFSIKTLLEDKQVRHGDCDDLGICGGANLDEFARALASAECWFGQLNGVSDLADLERRLHGRTQAYQALIGGEARACEFKINATAPGEPIAQTVEMLRETQVLPHDVPVLIRFDQFEQLVDFDDLGTKLCSEYQSVISAFLGTRDSRVSYKVGARKYGLLQEQLRVYGTGALLEMGRDYQFTDIDKELRRAENPAVWKFPALAEDIFSRRLKHASLEYGALNLKGVFDRTPNPHEKAQLMVHQSRARVIEEEQWPKAWVDALIQIAHVDPLSAKLGQAWLRQKPEYLSESPPKLPVPWDQHEYRNQVEWERPRRKWWKKERTQQALFQIASRCAQRPLWTGREDVLNLAGGNALIFITICKYVFDVYLFRHNEAERADEISWPIPSKYQTLGIYAASNWWYEIIAKGNKGNSRERLVRLIGSRYHDKLRKDKKMTYPGHNGFSVDKVEYERSSTKSAMILDESASYGDIVTSIHTSRSKSSDKRMKWYLQPILSPYFKIPLAHTKEPEYLSMSEIELLVAEAKYNMLER